MLGDKVPNFGNIRQSTPELF